jgi:hypothetical protein
VHTHFAAQPIEQPYGFPTIRPGQCLITRLKASSCFAFLQRLPTTDPSRFIQNRHLLWASIPLSTYQTWGSTGRGFAWPATFRLQGLVTLLAAYSPQALVGFVSRQQRLWDFTLRSFPLCQGSCGVSTTPEPTCRFSCSFVPNLSIRAGRASRGFWALTLARAPCVAEVIHLCDRRMLPWVLGPFQGSSPETLPAVPRRLLSRAWRVGPLRILPNTRRLRVSISLWPACRLFEF